MWAPLGHRLIDLLVFIGIAFVAYHFCAVIGYVATVWAASGMTAEQQYFESRLWRPFVPIVSIIAAYAVGLIAMVTLRGRLRNVLGLILGPITLMLVAQHIPDAKLLFFALLPALGIAWWTAPLRIKPSDA